MSFPKLVKAIYSWSGEEPGDLGFIEGDIIQVLNTGDGNWWNGQLKRNKTVGPFPRNFVEEFVSRSALSESINEPSVVVKDPLPVAADIDAGVNDMVKQLSISQGLEYNTEEPEYQNEEELYEDEDQYEDYYPSEDEGQDYEYMNAGGELPQDLPNTPPVPPPHALSTSTTASPTRVSSGTTVTPSHVDSQHLETDHTPSPLRQAMDGVLESLDHLKEISKENTVDGCITPISHDRNSMATLRASTFYENNPEISHHQSTPSLRISPRKSDHRDSSDDDVDMPFSPESYNMALNSEFYPMNAYSSFGRTESTRDHRQSSAAHDSNFQLVHKGSKKHIVSMDRADTYKSVSSAHTASMSSLSVSTTPSSISNFSATSASSLARRKFESIHGPDGKDSSNNYDMAGETPTKLPTDRTSDSRSVKSLSLKKSAGFLKKLLPGRNDDEDPFGQDVHLRRTKSRSSRMSVSSTSSKFKSGLRSLKNIGRSKDDAKSLYSRKSVDLGSMSSEAGFTGRSSSNWIDIRRDVHRCNTISHNERMQRDRRLEITGTRLVYPFKMLESVDGCEGYAGEVIGKNSGHDPKNDDYSNVDAYILGIRSWPQLTTPSMFSQSKIGRNLQYEADRVRAVFDFCAGKLTWRPTTHCLAAQETGDEELKLLSRLMHTRQGSANEIALCFRSMCQSIGITCELVRGHLKSPGESLDMPGPAKADHAWNAVVINGQWRFVDCVLANPGFVGKHYYSSRGNKSEESRLRQSQLLARSDSIASYDSGKSSNESEIDYFYYLTNPLEFIQSHVPCKSSDQHIIPALPDSTALGLPLAGPQSFSNHIQLVDFHTGLCKLENLEIAELNVSVTSEIDVWAEVLAGNTFNMNLLDASYDESRLVKIRGLSQPYWSNNQRFFRVKAFLPQPYSQGILNVYVGSKGSQLSSRGHMSLAYSMAITHDGSNAPFDFVTRHPTPHCKRQDIYMVQPQCRQLCSGNSYVFEVKQHPSNGLTSGSGISRVKIAMQSPSGKISKMSRKDNSSVHGVWEVTVKCYEVGTWRGLVLADSGSAWSVFAEWDCI